MAKPRTYIATFGTQKFDFAPAQLPALLEMWNNWPAERKQQNAEAVMRQFDRLCPTPQLRLHGNALGREFAKGARLSPADLAATLTPHKISRRDAGIQNRGYRIAQRLARCLGPTPVTVPADSSWKLPIASAAVRSDDLGF